MEAGPHGMKLMSCLSLILCRALWIWVDVFASSLASVFFRFAGGRACDTFLFYFSFKMPIVLASLAMPSHHIKVLHRVLAIVVFLNQCPDLFLHRTWI